MRLDQRYEAQRFILTTRRFIGFKKVFYSRDLPKKSAEVVPNPPAAAAMCPKCREGCCSIGRCGDAGLGLGAKILSMVNKELPLGDDAVAAAPRCLYTGLKPSPRNMFPKKCCGSVVALLGDGCDDVSTIFSSSSL